LQDCNAILHSAIAQAIVQRFSHSGLRAAWSSLTVEKAWISGHDLDRESDAGMQLRFSILALRRVPWREERESLNDFIVHFAVIL